MSLRETSTCRGQRTTKHANLNLHLHYVGQMSQSLSFNWFAGENTKAYNKNQMCYKLHITNWIQQNLGDVSACFFEQFNNLVKIETVFFQFRATNEKYTVQCKKTMQFCSIERHTHIPRKLQTYIHKQKMLYSDTHTQIVYPNTKLNCLTCWNVWIPIHKERASALSQQL